MISYEEFKEYVTDNILKSLPEECKDYELISEKVNKINKSMEALIIRPKDYIGAVPTIYFEDFYLTYEKCLDLDKTLEEMKEFYLRGMEQGKDFFNQVEMLSGPDNIIMTLINAEQNKEILEMCPHRLILDLAIVYRYIDIGYMGGINSALLTWEALTELEMSEEELFITAIENSKKILEPEVRNFENCFKILTNKYYVFGASAVLQEGVLQEIAKSYNSDLYLLPSSIHEFIIVPAVHHETDELRRMVKEANDSVLELSEILSYNVYYYKKGQDTLSIAS